MSATRDGPNLEYKGALMTPLFNHHTNSNFCFYPHCRDLQTIQKPLGSLFHPTEREFIEYLIDKRAGTLNHDKLINKVDNIYH